ncbi:Uncharacterized protein APZ42_011740 [Daphnia magna]|uniref:Uncharacterized protein n=1 Tax=Daphnia magna TaxID=35525 RepID=A0A162SYG5_9CRUS|nr:Uncharacterized protein APZ42_011740 [Daphnia magna]
MCMQLCFDLPKNWTFNIFLCWSAIFLPASNVPMTYIISGL